jgi:hypothetical protein
MLSEICDNGMVGVDHSSQKLHLDGTRQIGISRRISKILIGTVNPLHSSSDKRFRCKELLLHRINSTGCMFCFN